MVAHRNFGAIFPWWKQFLENMDEAKGFPHTESAKISHGLVRVEISLGVTIFHA